MGARNRNGVVSARAIAAVRSLASERWMPARWLRARASAHGISNTTMLAALRKLIASGEVEARGQTWTREYRKRGD